MKAQKARKKAWKIGISRLAIPFGLETAPAIGNATIKIAISMMEIVHARRPGLETGRAISHATSKSSIGMEGIALANRLILRLTTRTCTVGKQWM